MSSITNSLMTKHMALHITFLKFYYNKEMKCFVKADLFNFEGFHISQKK